MTTAVKPVTVQNRILTLDVLRGFALFGILLMNIQFFAMPEAAYSIPAVFGDLTGINLGVWWFSYLFADQKFMTLFSMLFGAGIVLMTSKAERWGGHSFGLHYRRMFWLLIIGGVHGYLLWSGDVLLLYAICGFVIYWFRRWSPRCLLLLGVIVFAIGPLLSFAGGLSIQEAPPEVRAGLAADFWPPQEVLDAEIEAYRSDWMGQMAARVPSTVALQTTALFFWGFWRAGGLMLMGMAFFKWGIFSSERRNRFYLVLIAMGLLIGLPVVAWGGYQNFARGWDPIYTRLGMGYQFNYWASLLVSLGYVGMIVLWLHTSWLAWLQHALGSVGRMALTNYLLQTIIATAIFYGHGFGLFATVSRFEQMLIVLGIWAFELVLSLLWLRHFRFGPVEWLWRSLTYWKLQPMRIDSPAYATSFGQEPQGE